jgi:DNA-binding GntR family transcriptional regulator
MSPVYWQLLVEGLEIMNEQIQEPWPIPKTMVDGITERLRRAIITGTIRPGERIRVGDLERKFGVSHIPIREALRRLQSEGFVEISPRRTTIAAGVDLSDLANIYDLRRIIEVEIGRRSVSRMTTNEVEAVQRALVSFQAVGNDPILRRILGASPRISLGAPRTGRKRDGQTRA